jgi:hypothetical protein
MLLGQWSYACFGLCGTGVWMLTLFGLVVRQAAGAENGIVPRIGDMDRLPVEGLWQYRPRLTFSQPPHQYHMKPGSACCGHASWQATTPGREESLCCKRNADMAKCGPESADRSLHQFVNTALRLPHDRRGAIRIIAMMNHAPIKAVPE